MSRYSIASMKSPAVTGLMSPVAEAGEPCRASYPALTTVTAISMATLLSVRHTRPVTRAIPGARAVSRQA